MALEMIGHTFDEHQVEAARGNNPATVFYFTPQDGTEQYRESIMNALPTTGEPVSTNQVSMLLQ